MIPTRPNLSKWALEHQVLVLYFMVALAIAGALSYLRLGQAEDPAFTFKIMVVRTFWPGATAREVEQEVTERLEKKLMETPWLDYTRSFSRPGESLIFVMLKDETPPREVPDAWYQVRKKLGDIRPTLPAGTRGPFFNDEFGDTFGNIYAFTTDGYSFAELRDHVEDIRRELLKARDVGKVEVLGEQQERVWVEISHRKLATLGIEPAALFATLQARNEMTPAGSFETTDDRVHVRASGAFRSVEDIRDTAIQAGGRQFRLGDIARVWRGYADPPELLMHFNGQPAMGLAVSMRKGGDIIAMGRSLDAVMERMKAQLPVGIDVHQVSDQPRVVSRSINEFMQTLAEAVIIVLAVSFLSLGWRTGIVVALSIPLVLAVTFLCMRLADIDLQRVSLGALIIALGLLVDDDIIAVEMMAIKMEQGWDRLRAGAYAYTSTAPSMLTGTLITAAGFLPVGLAKSDAGEYTFSIFAVVCIALLVSWVVAVLFIPYMGYHLLPDYSRHGHEEGLGARLLRLILRRRAAPLAAGPGHDTDVYQRPFYRGFRRLVTWCVTWRKTVIGITVGLFVLAVAGFGLIQQQFFPSANRPELVADLWLQEGASLDATAGEAKRFEAILAKDPDIEKYVTYIGGGSPRFYLPLDQQPFASNLVEFVITARDSKVRDALQARLIAALEQDFSRVRHRVIPLQNGPPVAYPVAFRVMGPDFAELRRLSQEVAAVMRANPHMRGVHLDWNEKVKTVRLDIDQDKARQAGVSSEDIANLTQTVLSGAPVTEFRERDKLIQVVVRAAEGERRSLDRIGDIHLPTRSGRAVPLSQLAQVKYELDEGVIWRRSRVPTITVQGDVAGAIQPAEVSQQIDPQLAAIRASLPPGYRVEMGGIIEESTNGQGSVNAVLPLMLLVVLTLLMVHLQSLRKALLVLVTAPLGIIGVSLFLLVGRVPFGFVAMLGFIALSGMIMRNSIILVDQIGQDIGAGLAPWDAIVEATVRRFRPIMLTAAAAILAMIPLSRSNFWGPMAVAIMGGLTVATVLTLLFLPALYAASYRVRRPA
jgi:multidrug efflux pump